MLRSLSRRLGGPALVAAAVAALLLGLELLHPAYFLWDDNAAFFLPLYAHDWRALADGGELAHLNYHQYLGQLHLANGQSAVLYPPIYLAAGLATAVGGDLRSTMDVLAVLHLVAAALGMLVLLRALGAPRWTATLAALLWPTYPFVAGLARSWIVVAYTAAFFPWSLWLLERLLRRPGAGRAVAYGAVRALFLLAGHAHYWVLTALLEGVYAVARWAVDGSLRRRWWHGAAALVGGGATSLALAAPLLLPMIEAKGISAYRTAPLSYQEFLSNVLELRPFLWAQLLRAVPHAVHTASGAIYYAGLPLLATAALLLRRRARQGVAAAPFLAAGLAAAVAFLLSTRAWGVVYGVPLLSSFRWPFKGFLLFLGYLTVAVAGSLAAAERRGGGWRWAPALVLLPCLAVHAWMLADERFDTRLGPNRLPGPVTGLRQEVAGLLPPGGGRVVSLWMTHLEARDPRLLAFNYATLAGAYHLGGYDPLIAEENLRLALSLEYSNIFRYRMTPAALDYLSSWCVRFLLLPAGESRGRTLDGLAGLRLAHRAPGVEVYENSRALPFVHRLEPAVEPVAFAWGVNGIRIDPAGRGGRLRVNVAPLRWYTVRIDGEDAGPPAADAGAHLIVDVPPGARRVELVYVDVPFRVGLGVAAAFLLAAAALAVVRRRRPPGALSPPDAGGG